MKTTYVFSAGVSITVLQAVPASADTIYGCVTFTNNSSDTVMLSSVNVENTYTTSDPDCPSSFPNGVPSGVVLPMQSVTWSSQDASLFSDTSGTMNATFGMNRSSTFEWDSPWDLFHGLGGACNGTPGANVSGGAVGAGDNNCVFSFTWNDGMGLNPTAPGGGVPLKMSALGDFNGDGVGDAMVTASSGSLELLGSSSGGFSAGPWSRSDLTPGTVKYTVGDFNGDGVSDLIITTINGSFEYTGLRAGALPQMCGPGQISNWG
jgi:hypothetical protein